MSITEDAAKAMDQVSANLDIGTNTRLQHDLIGWLDPSNQYKSTSEMILLALRNQQKELIRIYGPFEKLVGFFVNDVLLKLTSDQDRKEACNAINRVLAKELDGELDIENFQQTDELKRKLGEAISKHYPPYEIDKLGDFLHEVQNLEPDLLPDQHPLKIYKMFAELVQIRDLIAMEEAHQEAYKKDYDALRKAFITLNKISEIGLREPCYDLVAEGVFLETRSEDAQQLMDYADGKTKGAAPLQAVKDFVAAHRDEIEEFIVQNQGDQRQKGAPDVEVNNREHLKSTPAKSLQDNASAALKRFAKGGGGAMEK